MFNVQIPAGVRIERAACKKARRIYRTLGPQEKTAHLKVWRSREKPAGLLERHSEQTM